MHFAHTLADSGALPYTVWILPRDSHARMLGTGGLTRLNAHAAGPVRGRSHARQVRRRAPRQVAQRVLDRHQDAQQALPRNARTFAMGRMRKRAGCCEQPDQRRVPGRRWGARQALPRARGGQGQGLEW